MVSLGGVLFWLWIFWYPCFQVETMDCFHLLFDCLHHQLMLLNSTFCFKNRGLNNDFIHLSAGVHAQCGIMNRKKCWVQSRLQFLGNFQLIFSFCLSHCAIAKTITYQALTQSIHTQQLHYNNDLIILFKISYISSVFSFTLFLRLL